MCVVLVTESCSDLKQARQLQVKQGTQCVQTLGVFKLIYMFITNAHAHMCLRHACGQRTCTSRQPA